MLNYLTPHPTWFEADRFFNFFVKLSESDSARRGEVVNTSCPSVHLQVQISLLFIQCGANQVHLDNVYKFDFVNFSGDDS